MLTLISRLPADRREPGTLEALGAAGIEAGPWRCYGKADTQAAAEHGNLSRDPTRPFGDHPCGMYRLAAVHTFGEPSRTYGPAWISLEPLSGDAGQARINGRYGLLIHGGALRDGLLRPTHGCLRVDDSTVLELLDLWAVRAIGPGTVYRAELQAPSGAKDG